MKIYCPLFFLFGFLSSVSALSKDLALVEQQVNSSRTFLDADISRKKIDIRLKPLILGLSRPTDIQFFPGSFDRGIVLEQGGALKVFSLIDGVAETVHRFKVHSYSELGLLGMAFHPKFEKNRQIYIHYNPKDTKGLRSRISEWYLSKSKPYRITSERVLLEVKQPFSNHNAGQIAFGPSGYLYIGFGDGGYRNDPLEHGQNPKTFLGTLIRINVNQRDEKKPYSVPKDNPFVGREEILPEVWAYGLRNPWRFSFESEGRLIVADVGQNSWEEISIVPKGGNLGWNIWEGRHCFNAPTGEVFSKNKCETKNIVQPIHEYSRQEGESIIGGYIYEGASVSELKGKYLFSDYVSGKIWALDLKTKEVFSLGKWNVRAATFGRDAKGEVYIAGHKEGVLFKFDRFSIKKQK